MCLSVEVTVVVRSSQLKAVSERLEKLEGSGEVRMHFSIAEVSDDDEQGSADALRSLRGRIKVSFSSSTTSLFHLPFIFFHSSFTFELLLVLLLFSIT